MKVLVLLATGFEDLEALGTIALLRRGKLDVDICSVENKRQVIGRYGINVSSDVTIRKVKPNFYDALFIPGGMPGVDNLFKEKKVHDFIRYFIEQDKVLACICAAPSIPGRLGLLRNKKFTCYPGFEKLCVSGSFQDDSVIVDGNLITGKAAGCIHEFSYEIIKNLNGEKIADKMIESIYYKKYVKENILN